MTNSSRGIYEKYTKRLLDIVASGSALILLSPVLLITSGLVLIKMGNPILFCQERPGKDERIFKLYKFRSMKNAIDKSGRPLPDDERLTKFGRILRSTSLDELPELINILKGDMSIVGPRPLLPEYLPYYTEEERKRHSVRPGLTGLAQVNGRNTLTWEEKFAWDIKYVENISFKEDMKIIFETVLKTVKRSDILVGSQHIVGRLDDERRSNKEGKV